MQSHIDFSKVVAQIEHLPIYQVHLQQHMNHRFLGINFVSLPHIYMCKSRQNFSKELAKTGSVESPYSVS